MLNITDEKSSYLAHKSAQLKTENGKRKPVFRQYSKKIPT